MPQNYKIVFSPKSKKDIKKIDKKIQIKIIEKISLLSSNFDLISPSIKKLIASANASHRLRIGNYRVLYDIYHKDKAILIIRIGHRKDVYK